MIDAPGGRMTVVERNGRVVACCQREHRGADAYFGLFAVRPEPQGAGLGKVVPAEAERLAPEERGAAEMRLTVVSAREDLRFETPTKKPV